MRNSMVKIVWMITIFYNFKGCEGLLNVFVWKPAKIINKWSI